MVVAVRGEIVDGHTFFQILLNEVAEVFHAAAVGDSHFLTEVAHRRHVTEPDDVVDVDVVAEEVFFLVVYVNHTDQSFAFLTEIIEETAVLTEFIGVGRIVARRIIVA